MAGIEGALVSLSQKDGALICAGFSAALNRGGHKGGPYNSDK